MEKIDYVYNFVIELTRRCNAACSHCLRGEPEPIDIKEYYLNEVFQRIKVINSLTITGGEPSLRPDLIHKIVELARFHGVDIYNFYLATNAFHVTHDFIRAVMELYLFCTDNEISAVDISNTPFHDAERDSDDGIELLRLLQFCDKKYGRERLRHLHDSLINQGRCDYGRELKVDTETYIEIEGKGVGSGELYLNCNGDILVGCDWSYESQRTMQEIKICKVDELDIDTIVNWQRRTSYGREEKL